MKKMQKNIETLFGTRDRERDISGNLCWLAEEVGELIKAIRKGDRENEEEEFADVLAWLISCANSRNIDLEEVFYKKYGDECPRCKGNPCKCE